MHQLALLHDAPVTSTTDISQVLQDKIIGPDELPRNPIVKGARLHNSTACCGVNDQLLAIVACRDYELCMPARLST